MSLLANGFDVRSVLHGQVILAAVNQVYVIHEAMNDQSSTSFILTIYTIITAFDALEISCI